MKTGSYKGQVNLLLKILPEIAKESTLALHGGTAINLFIRDMPRLSVDADLTYLPIEDREISMSGMSRALLNISANIKKILPSAQIEHKAKDRKLLVNDNGSIVKIEISVMNRGTLATPQPKPLCVKAQMLFDAFCEIAIVEIGQLYGGKICAALDRQHPRDIFDIKYMLATEGFTQEIKHGFMLLLLSSSRAINEILQPNLQDQRSALENQFTGMTEETFSYEDYEYTRTQLIHTIQGSLTQYDKEFLLNFKNAEPDFSVYNFADFPAIKWKLYNLQKLKRGDPEKHLVLYNKLAALLESL